MAEIAPFRGLRYDTSRVRLDDVVCGPYDVIGPAEAAVLRARSPHGAIHLELPLPRPGAVSDDRYAAAAELLAAWQSDGTLRRDDEPTLYLLEHAFTGPDGWERTRHGIICLLKVEEFARRVVLPHEKTHKGPKADRLKLMRATHADLSQILMLYADPGNEVGAALAAAPPPLSPPLEVADRDGNRCRLRPLTGATVDRIVQLLAPRQVLIADGHHRYETAIAYRDERRAADDDSGDRVMVYLSSMDDPGLAIFPTHRLLKGFDLPPADTVVARLREHFAVFPEEGGGAGACSLMMNHVATLGGGDKVFGLYFPAEERCVTVELRDMAAMTHLAERGFSPESARLSVTILDELVFRDALGLDPDALEGHIAFAKSVDDAMTEIDEGGCSMAAFLNATLIEEVRAVAARGEVMPQKSTYFYPKLLTGLVFHQM
jgi:uncharacterized protein (DUF1015 family)